MRRSRISGIGMSLPERPTTNAELARYMDTSDEWIRQRSGIRQRWWVPQDTSTSTSKLAVPAVEEALADAGLAKGELDMIVFATLSPDALFPGSACYLQAHLEVPGIPAIDIRQQCSGFLYGLSMADLYIRDGQAQHVLVVGAEIQSKCLDISTRGREMGVLFGDGAGAAIVSATEVADASPRTSKESCLYSVHMHADGRYADDLVWQSPGSQNRTFVPPELVTEIEGYPRMNGRVVFTHAARRMPEVMKEALDAHGLASGDVDLYVVHQANLRINDKFAEALAIPPERIFNTIEDIGNTTAATIPIGLAMAKKAGRLERGMLVASAAFGSGFTWASALYRW
ncbi:MAG: beta-ketoacyl-ACP synthase III [Planctomycetota bacterium]